jgi:hypothetical protein
MKTFASLGFLAAFATLAAAPASAEVDVRINIGPPVPMVEVVPAPRAGFVWAPGFWAWRHHRHIWVAGHWIRERRGWHWIADRWDRDGERWHYVPGHWER